MELQPTSSIFYGIVRAPRHNMTTSPLRIVIPLAGLGMKFKEAGYAFPKALIDIHGQTMIERVIKNIKPQTPHSFAFVCQREHYEKYDLYNILKNAVGGDFDVVQLGGITEGAACTVLSAINYINNEQDLLIVNADQYFQFGMDTFIQAARSMEADGAILTFKSSHPKWSYVRVGASGYVLEAAEKKVISDSATAGVYYFKRGSDFVQSAQSMILKNIRHNNEFYVCPVYNELILAGKRVKTYEVDADTVHGLGTPEDVQQLLRKIEEGKLVV